MFKNLLNLSNPTKILEFSRLKIMIEYNSSSGKESSIYDKLWRDLTIFDCIFHFKNKLRIILEIPTTFECFNLTKFFSLQYIFSENLDFLLKSQNTRKRLQFHDFSFWKFAFSFVIIFLKTMFDFGVFSSLNWMPEFQWLSKSRHIEVRPEVLS